MLAYPLVQIKLFFVLLSILFNQKSILFIQRELFPRKVGSIRKAILNRLFSKHNVIWDFDDNIFEMNEISSSEFESLSKNSSAIIVCNNFLRNLIDKEFHQKVSLIPTSDIACSVFDYEKTKIARVSDYEKIISLGWLGTFNNLKFLENILPDLENSAEILKRDFNKELQLKIISDTELDIECRHLKILNIKWTREGSIEELLDTHIGLMPLDNNKLTEGKCAFKAVQYIGFGIPVIASNVGFNKEVIVDSLNGYLISENESWVEKIISLSTNKELWLEFSKNSRKRWIENFNTNDILSKLKNHLGQNNK